MIKLDFLKKKKIFTKHGTQPDPNIFWMFIFYAGFLLTILSFVFGFYVFLRINKTDVLPEVNPNEQLKKISKDRLNKVLDIFVNREKNVEQILDTSTIVSDPSI